MSKILSEIYAIGGVIVFMTTLLLIMFAKKDYAPIVVTIIASYVLVGLIVNLLLDRADKKRKGGS